MIAERIEANVLQASIPGEEASERWGRGTSVSFLQGICQEKNHKRKEETLVKFRSSYGCMCVLLRRPLVPTDSWGPSSSVCLDLVPAGSSHWLPWLSV